MKQRIISALFLGILAATVSAASLQVIKLRDQSVIRGEILEMKGGVYLVKTPTLGEIKVPADQVLAILNEDAATQPPTSSPAMGNEAPARAPGIREGRKPSLGLKKGADAGSGPPAVASASQPSDEGAGQIPQGEEAKRLQQDVNGRVQSMMMNGSFLDKMMGLGDSESLQSVLEDPEVMGAIQSGDYEKLMNDPKMQQLMESPEMRDILGDVEK